MAGGNFQQSCPYFFTREGATLNLAGLYRGAAAFLIGGGPSFSEIDRSKLARVWTMTLNNAAASYRSNANCSLGEASRVNYSVWCDPLIQKFAPLSVFERPLWDNRLLNVDGKTEQQWRRAELLPGDCPNVAGFRRNESFEGGSFLHEDTISCGAPAERGVGRSVLLPALRILFLLGFRKVYLLGVDFKITEEKPYHFHETCPPAKVRAKIKTFALMQRWLAELQPLFLAENFVIKNCNPHSDLKAFPFMAFDEAIEAATTPIGDLTRERTHGMQMELEAKEEEIELQRLQTSVDQTGRASSDSLKTGHLRRRRASEADDGKETRVKKRLILCNYQSPGDIMMLTAAVRDLHKCYPGEFQTDVRTSSPPLWDNNPYLTTLKKKDSRVEVIDCHYPLVHRSNVEPWHFIHGFIEFLNEKLDIRIQPTDFKGDIHLSAAEKGWVSQVQEITGQPVPFWIITAGGKLDFTIKWWAHERFQSVVNHHRGRILFVQVGEDGHNHPPLNGVLDFRGKTNLRELVRLVYHSQGVLCPVTLPMHLAAAVETAPGMPKNRPCVVVAGGREPPQWETYPHHQFIHTNGSLPCCEQGGCWKSRTTPIGDGDDKDKASNLCVDVVPRDGSAIGQRVNGAVNALAHPKEEWGRLLPRCMDMITAEEVIRRMDTYFSGGMIKYLSEDERAVCKKAVPSIGWD